MGKVDRRMKEDNNADYNLFSGVLLSECTIYMVDNKIANRFELAISTLASCLPQSVCSKR